MRSIGVISLFALLFFAALLAGVVWLKSDGTVKVTGVSRVKSLAESANSPVWIDFELPRVNGTRFVFQNEKDMTVVINFWASWCEPCLREFPGFLSLAKKLGPDYLFLLISVDESRNSIDKFLKAFGDRSKNIEVLWDQNSKIAAEFGTRQLPETFIFGPGRKFVRKVIGFEEWTSVEIENFFRKVQAKKQP